MADSAVYDHYRIWLGIPRAERPPNHYRLLGIGQFEADPDVISSAADRQMAHVKSFQNGPHVAASQKLLSELAAARVCLLSIDRKREYDATLRRALASQASAAAPVPPSQPAPTFAPNGTDATAPSELSIRSRSSRVPVRRRSQGGAMLAIGITVAGFLVASVIIAVSLQEPISPPVVATAQATPADTQKRSERDGSRNGAIPSRPAPSRRPRTSNEPPALTDVVERVLESVMVIQAGRSTMGSGVVVGEGAVLTNYHVVAGAASVYVTDSKGNRQQVLGHLAVDPAHDLVLLKIEAAGQPQPIPLAAELPKLGEDVAAFGNPAGLRFSISKGIVSAVRSASDMRKSMRMDVFDDRGFEPDAQWIQHTAAVSHGSSGGPLVNAHGELVGLNTLSQEGGQNLNFAVAVTDIQTLLADSGVEYTESFANLPTTWQDKPTIEPSVQPARRRRQVEASKVSPPPSEAGLVAESTAKSAPSGLPPARINSRAIDEPFPNGHAYDANIFDVESEGGHLRFDEDDPNIVIVRHTNGSPYAIASQQKGRLHGLTFGRYPDKQPMVYANYFDGRRHGILKTWSPDGEPVTFAEYRLGKRNGITCVFEAGKLTMVALFAFDELQCLRLTADEFIAREFLTEDDARADEAARNALELLASLDATMKASEIDLRRAVKEFDEELRKERAREYSKSVRGNASKRYNQRQADHAAAFNEMIDTMRSVKPLPPGTTK